MISEVYNMDCMELMKKYPDKYFDLAVVDPPYGINFAKQHTGKGWVVRDSKDWDKSIPKYKYWEELSRVSKDKIIWGGNYFTEFLPPSMGWIFWDKGQRNFSLADGELAWTSFNKALRVFDYSRAKLNKYREGTHPTEKPVALYDWIYKNYLPEGGKVLDTHLGSGSNRIAADKAGNIDFTACEIDKDYFDAQEKRFSIYKSQLKLFAA
jgi:site-specific DNA-methyltransferase (adenine-specific)